MMFSQFTPRIEYDSALVFVGYDSFDPTPLSNFQISIDHLIAIVRAQLKYTAQVIPDLANNTGGVISNSISSVPDSVINNNFASITDKINKINTALASIELYDKA